MDVLALYDIHGNPDALDAVLADPRAAGPDAVVVGGDAVPGPFAAAVLDRLDALAVPVHRIRGNGEREVADPPAGDGLVAETARRSAAELGPERTRALGALPLTLERGGVALVRREPREHLVVAARARVAVEDAVELDGQRQRAERPRPLRPQLGRAAVGGLGHEVVAGRRVCDLALAVPADPVDRHGQRVEPVEHGGDAVPGPFAAAALGSASTASSASGLPWMS